MHINNTPAFWLAVLFAALALVTALQTFIRMCIVQNDTDGLGWLLPIARIRWRGEGDAAERAWFHALTTTVFFGALSVYAFIVAMKAGP